jgi:hypothetical protein
VHSRAIPLRLGDGTLGHMEGIWQRRSRGTWHARIWAVYGDRWAQGESDLLKSFEEACAEWVVCMAESGAGT